MGAHAPIFHFIASIEIMTIKYIVDATYHFIAAYQEGNTRIA